VYSPPACPPPKTRVGLFESVSDCTFPADHKMVDDVAVTNLLYIAPVTSSLDCGFIFPIPTFPFSSILNNPAAKDSNGEAKAQPQIPTTANRNETKIFLFLLIESMRLKLINRLLIPAIITFTNDRDISYM
jgi:hypothetical protein